MAVPVAPVVVVAKATGAVATNQTSVNTINLTRYGALSSGLQTSNGATTLKTPTKNGSAMPASRKRAIKLPQKLSGF